MLLRHSTGQDFTIRCLESQIVPVKCVPLFLFFQIQHITGVGLVLHTFFIPLLINLLRHPFNGLITNVGIIHTSPKQKQHSRS